MTHENIITELNRRLDARSDDRGWKHPLDHTVCADGFVVSIQAGEYLCCEPRAFNGPYTAFELGFPSEADELIQPYAKNPDNPTGTVYGYVPAAVVAALIAKHGGFSQ